MKNLKYQDLRQFLAFLEQKKLIKTISLEVDPYLEITEISSRVLAEQGVALLFENPKNHKFKLVSNLFGTTERVALGMGADNISKLRQIGVALAQLKQPKPPKNIKDAINQLPMLKKIFSMKPKVIKNPPCQQVVHETVDLNMLPIQTCWPQDIAPLISWGLVITKNQERQNLGIYRQQLLAKNKLIMRWLAHRGGALDFQSWQKQNPNQPFPVAVAIGTDPATTLAAVIPIPDDISEYAFAGLLREAKTEVSTCLSHDLQVPAHAEIILEGFIYPDEMADEGPFGDHTGYYNEVEQFPVFTVEKITHRHNPIYHSTYTGKPPDEPSVLGEALNEVFIPLLQQQFPEITDFYLPPEGCSYRMAIVSINKQYPGHAKRIMFGVWSFLRQFMYTKFIVVVDDDIDIRKWSDVIWAITTRFDPVRDLTLVENTPIDYLDFASVVSGLGSKMGLDATNKWQGETNREWGRVIKKDQKVKDKIDKIWQQLGL